MEDDDDDDKFMYENGTWIWDDDKGELAFMRQFKFRKLYQRKHKPGEIDVVRVQDVKDVVLYTSPVQMQTPKLIKMLHRPTTERFIRALILYFEYYLQVADRMSERVANIDVLLRTPECEKTEAEFRDNLQDLRLLLAKEYSAILLGWASDVREFHHMGAKKSTKSLRETDVHFFELFLRMCVQIVWIALGRISLTTIELEMHRLFKSDYYNCVEHRLKSQGFAKKMTKLEKSVLAGPCVSHVDGKLWAISPLCHEYKCEREVDYRMLALGNINATGLSLRLQYMRRAIADPEELLLQNGVVLGIIGMKRAQFDSMLRLVADPLPSDMSRGASSKHKSTTSKLSGAASARASKSKKMTEKTELYPKLVLPPKSSAKAIISPEFEQESEQYRPCDKTQCELWLRRRERLGAVSSRRLRK